MFRRLLFLLVSVSAIITMQAADRTDAEMTKLAMAHFKASEVRNNGTARTQAVVKINKVVANNAFTIFNSEGIGCVIISHDTSLPAIIGYASTAYSENNPLPEGFVWWLETMEKTLSAKSVSGTATPQKAFVNFTAVPALMTSTWGQESPFNDQCPAIKNRKAPAGCVATATSQIIYHYKYPASGTGTGSYTINNSGIPRTKDITSTYDWASMLDDYGTEVMPLGTPQQRAAVATLLFDVGAAVKMDYQADASGAYNGNAAAGLVDNFKYDESALAYCSRDYYTTDQWMEMVYGEIEAGRPILYGGADELQGGHAFVLDGINADGLVHANWGWSGAYDGFFNIDLLNPSGFSFSAGQVMVIGIKPQPTPANADIVYSQWGLDNYTMTSNNLVLEIKAGELVNIHHRDFSGKLGLCIKDGSDLVEYLSMTSLAIEGLDDIEVKCGYGWAAGADNNLLFIADASGIPAGTYTAFLASKDKREKEPQAMKCYGGAIYYTITKSADGKITVSEPTTEPTAVNVPTVGRNTSDNIYSIDGRLLERKSSETNTTILNGNHHGIVIKNGKKVIK